jgi:lipooligosaccharide transport system permease protein
LVRPPPPAAAPAPREAAPRRAQLPRLDAVAIGGVMSRELTVFTRTWRSTTFSAVVEPTIFLLAFGLGFGALISQVRGIDYMEFVGTGVVATTVVFSSAFPAMYSTWIKSRFQHIYDAVLATPVNVKELVTAEVLWIALRTGVYAIAPLGVAIAYGMKPGWGIVAVPFIAFLTGFGFAAFGVTVAAMAKAITNFNFIISGLLTPLLLLAGAYFPVAFLPQWARTLDQVNPLFHCVELVRDAVFGFNVRRDLVHVAALMVFAGVMWWLAVQRLRPVLID